MRAATLPHLGGVVPIRCFPSHIQIKANAKLRRAGGTRFPITGADCSRLTLSCMFLMFPFLIVLDKIIGLLRGFDDEMFLQAHEPELIDEGERLEERNIVIGEW